MSDHLQPAQIEGYLQRALAPQALLAADDHLSACEECRARTAESAPPIRQLRRSLAIAHLTHEQLEQYADGRLPDEEAAAHLRECPACLAEADDLRQFVGEGTTTHPHTRHGRRRLAVAAAVCAVLVGGALLLRQSNRPTQVATAPSVPVLPDDLRGLRDEALRQGHIDIAPEILGLRGKVETQLGRTAEVPLELESPLGTGVLTSRPRFRWKPYAGAQGYEVSLFYINGRRVASSGPLRQPSWTPAVDLAPGEVYVWELSVWVDGKQHTAPRPPAPQARFVVIADSERARLAEIAARFPNEHTLLGVLYAHAGALEDARRELAAAANAGQKDVGRLLDSL